MKLIITSIILFATICVDAQTMLTPKTNAVEKKWVTNTSYQMIWYAVKDTVRFEIGKTTTNINVSNNKIIVVTSVNMKQTQSPWIDSTVANTKDLSPDHHSSYNAQRDMVLNFGTVVKGFYKDKINNKNTVIVDTTTNLISTAT